MYLKKPCKNQSQNLKIEQLTNTLAAAPEGSTPLIPKPAIGHDPEPVPSTSHPLNLFPQDPSY
jgi:hypothetical protein